MIFAKMEVAHFLSREVERFIAIYRSVYLEVGPRP